MWLTTSQPNKKCQKCIFSQFSSQELLEALAQLNVTANKLNIVAKKLVLGHFLDTTVRLKISWWFYDFWLISRQNAAKYHPHLARITPEQWWNSSLRRLYATAQQPLRNLTALTFRIIFDIIMYFAAVLTCALCLLQSSSGFQRSVSRYSNRELKQSHLLDKHSAFPAALQRLDLTLSQSSNDDPVKSGGIEPKYLGALGVFIFAALYDFFITHGGQPYLAHPPTLWYLFLLAALTIHFSTSFSITVSQLHQTHLNKHTRSFGISPYRQ